MIDNPQETKRVGALGVLHESRKVFFETFFYLVLFSIPLLLSGSRKRKMWLFLSRAPLVMVRRRALMVNHCEENATGTFRCIPNEHASHASPRRLMVSVQHPSLFEPVLVGLKNGKPARTLRPNRKSENSVMLRGDR